MAFHRRGNTFILLCGNTLILPFRAKRGIPLFLNLNRREIPRFARNDKINRFFRNPFYCLGSEQWKHDTTAFFRGENNTRIGRTRTARKFPAPSPKDPPAKNIASGLKTSPTKTSGDMSGQTHNFVIPRRAARRGISLFLRFNPREIPRFARNDKIKYFSHLGAASLRSLQGWGFSGLKSHLSHRFPSFHQFKPPPF